MAFPKCEECRKEGATKRCTKCQVCFYCDRECQTKNWKMHKRVCSEDPLVRDFVPVEMAIERAIKVLPSPRKLPSSATCQLCLEDFSRKKAFLDRGCRCSSAFVHVSCLAEFAERHEEATEGKSWRSCMLCDQPFEGGLVRLKLLRLFWRRHRNGGPLARRAKSDLSSLLQSVGEAGLSFDMKGFSLRIEKAAALYRAKREVEALSLLEKELLPEAREAQRQDLMLSVRTLLVDILLELERFDEGLLESAADAATIAREIYGLDDARTLQAKKNYGLALAMTGSSFTDTKLIFADVIKRQKKNDLRETKRTYATLLNDMIERACALKTDDRRDDALVFLESVLSEVATSDYLDEKDAENRDANFDTALKTAAVLQMFDRLDDSERIGATCVDFATRAYGLEAQETCIATYNYAMSLFNLERFEESEAILTSLSAIQTRLFGSEHTMTSKTDTFLQRHHLLDDDNKILLKEEEEEEEEDKEQEQKISSLQKNNILLQDDTNNNHSKEALLNAASSF